MRVSISGKKGGLLSDALAAAGYPLDMRCAGHGVCGMCRVHLVSGKWKVNGVPVETPCDALACRTGFDGDSGVVDIPGRALAKGAAKGSVLDSWRGVRSLPECADTVFALDIGTTTLAAVRLDSGRVTARASCFNPQGAYGDNVLDRIIYESEHPGELRTVVIDTAKKLFAKLGGAAQAKRIAVAGNTVMTSIFHGTDPSPIGVMPFTPKQKSFPVRTDMFGGTPVLTLPAVSGYIGGDLTAGLFMTSPGPGEMLVDLGTNCEMIFNTGDGMTGCAAAAGPAFEGAGITCGCRAVEGALSHYRSPEDIDVIGGGSAQGICGSGMIDVLAYARKNGRINEFGRVTPEAPELNMEGTGLSLSEKDIEQLLKAKAAVMAGIRTLEGRCGRKASKLILAGGFAAYLDMANACATGMLPEGRVYCAPGNTSLAGAAYLACAPESYPEFERLASLPEELPLNTLPTFEDNYIDSLILP